MTITSVYFYLVMQTLKKLITFMVRRPTEAPVVQAHHERNQITTVRPEFVEAHIQRFPNYFWFIKVRDRKA